MKKGSEENTERNCGGCDGDGAYDRMLFGEGGQKPAGEASGPQGQAADSGKQAGAAGSRPPSSSGTETGRKPYGPRWRRSGTRNTRTLRLRLNSRQTWPMINTCWH